MSNTKTVMSQAANTQGIPLDITDVFSTYLYTGNNATRTITNGIDLDGEGGMVWFKDRDQGGYHHLFDTARGVLKAVFSNDTLAETTYSNSVTAFNSNGFSLGNSSQTNYLNQPIASWTFRKAPKFFDVVTWTGDGNSATIPHNLGCTPGMIIVKKTSGVSNWLVWHKDKPSNNGELNTTNAVNFASYINSPTPTGFNVWGVETHEAGATYVAYLFAHNDGDGGFGPNADQDIIKCGSYTGNGSTTGPVIDLGFEPQWLLIKNASGVSNWLMVDNMRGFPVGSDNARLFANLSNAEVAFNGIDPTATGFKLVNSTGGYNTSGNTYIYMAIRRGPLAQPESATEVFAIEQSDGSGSSTSPEFVAGFPVDAALLKATTISNGSMRSRLTGTGFLETNSTSTEGSNSFTKWDFQNGWYSDPISTNYYSWMWKRAPGFFDVVAYTGDGTAGRTISHNLGVAPEMMWVKKRSGVESWAVYHSLNGGTHFARLQGTDAYVANSNVWGNTDTTASVFTVDTDTEVNQSGQTYIAYLFATVPNVSKVGSYTGNGSSQTIDCGFTTGARFILIKRTDSTGDWYIWDTTRGIVAGNDPHLSLNTTVAEVTTDDSIDPDNSGFIVNQLAATNINVTSASYIFYAIA